jgi:sugar phosphate isomerase/epimerase
MSVPVNRRQFLERASLGAAAFAAARALPPLAAQQPSSGMFISLAPWATARGVGWPDQARLAAKVGYAGIDYAWGPAKEAGVEATRALMKELGIVPTICNLPTPNPLNGDEAAFKARMATMADDAALSAAFGSRRFQLVLGATTPGGQSKEERWKVVRDRLAAISEVFVKHDVHLSLEFLGPLVFRSGRGGGGGRRGGGPPDPAAPPPPPPVPFVWTLAETARLCEQAGPNIGVTLDAWHWHHSGGTVADILATPRERIVHVHVSDARQMPPADVQDNMRLLPGEGIIDLVGFFQALRTIGWQGGVACETIGPRLDNMPPEQQARLGLETTTAIMKKAGVL